MKSGKTLQLLQILFQYASVSKNVLLAKSVTQRNTDCDCVVSRASKDHRVTVDYLFDSSFDFTRDISELDKANCILVDESQFLTAEQVDQLKEISQKRRIEVICYGLLTDFKSNLFDGSKRLIEQSDVLEKMSSYCYYCRKHAGYNMRHDEHKNPVFEGELIKENDVYQPACWDCYVNGANLVMSKG